MRNWVFGVLLAGAFVLGFAAQRGYAQDEPPPDAPAEAEAPAPAPADEGEPADAGAPAEEGGAAEGEAAPAGEGEAPEGEAATEEAAPAEKPAAEPGKKAEGKPISLFQTVRDGGIIGYLIILLSFVGLSLIIEHAVAIRRDKLIPQGVVHEIEDLFEKEEYEEALELCEVERSFLTNVVGAGLSKIAGGYDRMSESMQEAGEEAATGLHQKISYLSLIGNVAPMLGLLGTVTGMIAAFSEIHQKGAAVKPADMARGISQALVTTCMGLIVAIPVLCAFQYFRNKVVRTILEAGVITSEMMDRFRPAEK